MKHAIIFIYRSPFWKEPDYLEVKDDEISDNDPETSRDNKFDSMQSDREDLSVSQYDRSMSSYRENYMIMHSKSTL